MKNYFIKLKKQVETLAGSMTEQSQGYYQVSLFRKMIYLWCLFQTLLLLPKAQYFWGPYSLIPPQNPQHFNFLTKLLNLLSYPQVAPFFIIFVILQISFLLLSLFKDRYHPRFCAFCIYFLTINLDNKMHLILDGGHNLIHLMLFYNIFFNIQNKSKFKSQKKNQSQDQKNTSPNLPNAFHNIALIIARLQLLIVYFIAGIAKTTGPFWQKGLALFYTLNVPEYTTPLLQNFVNTFPLSTVFATYFTILFQISFPFLIWNYHLRPLLLFIGSIMHLSISFGMGLVTFGLAMCVCYILFIEEEKCRRIIKNLSINFRFRTNPLRTQ